MRRLPLFWVLLIVVLPLASLPGARAGTPVDVHCPQACNNCGHEGCIERTPVQDCVVGEKKVYKTTIHKSTSPSRRSGTDFKWCASRRRFRPSTARPSANPKTSITAYQAEHWQSRPFPAGRNSIARLAKQVPRNSRPTVQDGDGQDDHQGPLLVVRQSAVHGLPPSGEGGLRETTSHGKGVTFP